MGAGGENRTEDIHTDKFSTANAGPKLVKVIDVFYE